MAKTPSKVNKKTLSDNRWFANVAKSLGYAAADVMHDVMPATTDTFKSNASYVKETIADIKAVSKQRNMNAVLRKMVGDSIDDYLIYGSAAKANIKEDLKSGKFYNKERADAIMAKSMGMDDFNMDDLDNDDNWSMDDFDIDEDIESSGYDDDSERPEVNVSVTPKISLSSNINGDNPMVRAVSSQTDLMVNIAKDTANRDIKLHGASLAINQKMIYGIGEHLGVINENLGRLLEFNGDTISKFTSASLAYYEEALTLKRDVLEELRKFNAEKEDIDDGPMYDDPYDYSTGAINIKGYADMVRRNTKRWTSNNFLLSSLSMFKESGGFEQLAANPLAFIPRMLMSSILPKNLRSTAGAFDKTLGAFFPALLGKVDGLKGSSNILLQTLGEIFGYNQEIKTMVNTADFERGKVDFDGITRKSIVEVIPGYLSKILSALNGDTERLTFDYNRGVFTTVDALTERFEEDRKRTILSSYEGLDKVFDLLNFGKVEGNDNALDPLKDKIRKGFLRYTNSDMFINPRDFDPDDPDTKNSLAEVFDDLTDDEQKLFRTTLSLLKRNELMNLFGRDKFEAREARTDFFRDAQINNDGSMVHNELYKDRSSSGYSLSSSLDTWKTKEYADMTDDEKKKYRDWQEQLKKDRELAKKTNEERGITSVESLDDLYNMDEDELRERIAEYEKKTINFTPTDDKSVEGFINSKKDVIEKKSIFQHIHGLLQAPAKIAEKFIDKLDEGLFNIIFPSKTRTDKDPKSIFEFIGDKFGDGMDWIRGKLDSFLTKADEKLFGEEGLITKIQNSKQWEKFKEIFGKGFDFTFGKKGEGEGGYREGGLFSDVFNNMKEMGNRFISYFTGKDFKDKDGNEIKGDKENSVFGIFKKHLISFKDTMAEYIFGTNDKEGLKDKGKGFLGNIKDTLYEGGQVWLDAIFGMKDKAGEKVSAFNVGDFTEKVKNALPKALAVGLLAGGAGLLASAGGFGILGSMFLGPMSGAVLGITGGFLSQSERFKDWLFGPMDAKTNARIGGFISKGAQDFLAANKVNIIGGGTIGAISGGLGFGILPSFILGGPITGALTGIATALLLRSESFKNMLFGAKETVGNAGIVKAGAELGKSFMTAHKLKFGAGAVGGIGGMILGKGLGSFGLLGSLAINPMALAITGAATGILLTSDKWKDFLFGKAEFDANGNVTKDGGIFGRFGNYLQMEVLEPFKFTMSKWTTNIQNWFDEKIATPFSIAMVPIKEEFSRIGIRLKELGETVKDTIANLPGLQVLKDFVKKLNPIPLFKSVSKFMIEKTASVFGKVLEFPVKILSSVSERLYQRHIKEGLTHYRGLIKDEIKRRLVDNPIVQGVVKPAFTFIRNGVSDLFGFTKKLIQGTFGLLGKAMMGFGKLTLKMVSAAITTPFKAIALPFQLMGMARGSLRDRAARKGADENILDRIRDGEYESSGELLKMLAASYLPGATRRSMQYSPEGAGYAKEMLDKKNKLISDSEYRSDVRNAFLDQDEENLRNKQAEAKKNKYNKDVTSELSSKEQRKLERAKRKEEEKALKNEYGKAYTNADSIEKSRVKMDRDNHENLDTISQKTSDVTAMLENDVEIAEETRKSVKTLADLGSEKGSIFTHDDGIHQRLDKLIELVRSDSKKDISSDLEAPVDTLAKAVTKGQEVFDTNDDKEEAEKKKKEEAKAKKEQQMAESIAKARSQNLANNRQISSELADRKERTGFFNTMKNFVKDIRDDGKEHKFNWASIFGKKGLITTGLILAIPFLLKFFKDPITNISVVVGDAVTNLVNMMSGKIKEIFGLKDDDGDRTDATGTTSVNYDAMEATGVAGVTNAARIAGDKYKAFTRFKADRQILSEARQSAVSVADEGVTAATRVPLTQKIKNAVVGKIDSIKNAVTGTAGAKETTITKFINAAKSVMKSIEKYLSKYIKGKHLSTLKSIVSKILSIMNPVKLAKFSGKIAATSAKFLMIYGDIAFMAYGVATGITKSEAANLFEVSQEDVTMKMRAVSAIVKGITSSSWGSLVALINEITKSLIGFDFIKTIAELLYSGLADEDDPSISVAQQKFNSKYQDDVMVQVAASGTDEDRATFARVREKQAQLKADPSLKDNAEFMNELNTDISSLTSQSNYSKDAFNDMQNKGFFGKVVDGASKAKKWLFGGKGDEEKLAQAKSTKAMLEQMLVEDESLRNDPGFMDVLRRADDSITQNTETTSVVGRALGSVGKWFSDITGTAGDFITNAFKSLDDKFVEIQTKWETFKTNVEKKIADFWDPIVDLFTGIGEKFNGGVEKIGDSFSGFIDGAKKTGSKVWNWVTSKFNFGGREDISLDDFDSEYNKFAKKHQGGAVLSQYQNYRKHLTSDFGFRNDPFTGKPSGHEGVDMARGLGSRIAAFVPGTVIAANHIDPATNDAPSGKGRGYGNNVIVKDKYGKLHLYAHMNSIDVKEGDTVELGDTIGREGSTGRSTGSHLHYSVMGSKYGNYVDPNKYIEGFDSGNPDLALAENTDDEFATVNPSTGVDTGMSTVIDVMSSTLNNVLAQAGLAAPTTADATSISADGVSTAINTNLPDGETPDKVWQFFTQNGYSKEATAGIMGNLYAESGMNPAAIQHGSGHAAGIAQWESYKNKAGRWLNMSNYAKKKGKDWTDLGSQLEFIHNELGSLDYYFKNDIKYGGNIAGSTLTNAGAVPTTYAEWKRSTDVDMATRQFEGAFERAGKPHMDRRLEAARGYYQKYSKTGTIYDNDSRKASHNQGGLDGQMVKVGSRIPDSKFVMTAPKDLFKDKFANNGIGGIGDVIETVAATAKTSGTDTTVVDNIVKIVTLLTEIATNTRNTTDNTAKIASKENAPTAVVANTNNVSSNPMFDIAKQRREEQTKSKYAIAKAVAQGIH